MSKIQFFNYSVAPSRLYTSYVLPSLTRHNFRFGFCVLSREICTYYPMLVASLLIFNADISKFFSVSAQLNTSRWRRIIFTIRQYPAPKYNKENHKAQENNSFQHSLKHQQSDENSTYTLLSLHTKHSKPIRFLLS